MGNAGCIHYTDKRVYCRLCELIIQDVTLIIPDVNGRIRCPNCNYQLRLKARSGAVKKRLLKEKYARAY